MIDFLAVIAAESARFAACIGSGGPDARVPSCPDWSLADLAWHLSEVQHHWGSIAAGPLLDAADVPVLERGPHTEVVAAYPAIAAHLVDALAAHDPTDRCWSWHPDGGTIGWVRRRQAHEVLIHRVDAELAVGDRTAIDEEVAADGVDEMMVNQLADDTPDWATFTPDGTGATVVLDGVGRYGLHLGRFRGTGPESGTDWDFETVVVGDPIGPEVTGTAVALDLWLWGRGVDGVHCDDAELLARLRSAIASATQ